MSIDPRNTVNTDATDPNRGMRTRPYLVAVGIALVVLLLALFLLVHRSSRQITPETPKRSSSLTRTVPLSA